jgi:hypothetical protein
MHESFLRHRRWLFLKIASALSVAAIAVYVWDDPPHGANGGTWLGYTLGTMGAILIVWLSWLGVRKRQYRSRMGTVKSWVSAHVYLGLALFVIATLHTGFQFGWNVHTLAYVLMVLVIASGVYGVLVYARYPSLITDNRAQSTREAWLGDILELNDQAIKLADTIDPAVHRAVVRAADRLRVGGGVRQQLWGGLAPAQGEDLGVAGELLRKKMTASMAERSAGAEQMIFFDESRIVMGERDPEAERLKQLLELLTRRNELAARINRDIQTHARMQIWLYLHVPLTAGLLAALLAHVVSVFLYW